MMRTLLLATALILTQALAASTAASPDAGAEAVQAHAVVAFCADQPAHGADDHGGEHCVIACVPAAAPGQAVGLVGLTPPTGARLPAAAARFSSRSEAPDPFPPRA